MPPVAVISTDKLYINYEIESGRERERETLQGLHYSLHVYPVRGAAQRHELSNER